MSSLPFRLLVPDPPVARRSALRDRVADLIAVLCALLYGAIMVPLGDATSPSAAIPWQADVVVGVLCALTLFARRRWPLAVCLILLPIGTVSVMATGAILIALFTVAIRYRAKVVFILAAAHVTTGIVYYALQDSPPFPLWVDIVMRAATGLATIGWGLFLRAYRRLTLSLRQEALRAREEQQLRIDQARLTERSRIAREMHDVLAHSMSMVSLHAGALEVSSDAPPAEIAAAARTIRQSAHEALEELRAVIGALREGDLSEPEPPQPGLADVEELVDGARTAGMTIDLVWLRPRVEPSPVLGRTAYRLLQEALTNARKHAPGESVDVRLDGATGGDLRILVTNALPNEAGGVNPAWHGHAEWDSTVSEGGVPTPGGSADRVPGSGSGLVGAGERAALVGGRVEYGPEDERFRFEAWLPWRE
ncbi:sensor histidine kinase [Paractinoplanes atraurantiacus]|uniref:histidine kinase n=1 Tax=Paractinoplanes atraurantiacus TaxID=1036182 RepID=A0A285GKD1_9ACTN|nr:histidine kinase [Actinoplanes atraurantiacus]SNY23773.1 Signal transduction histidine kinase [Actinoplanes atraurantiacus]